MLKTLIAFLVVILILLSSTVNAAPSNDSLAGATMITVPGSFNQTDVNLATGEGGEPAHSCSLYGGLNSVWFQFTLAQSGVVTVNTDQGSSYKPGDDTLLSIYDTGLTEVACNDNVTPTIKYAAVSIELAAGTYYIKVSNGSQTPLQATSELRLTTSFIPISLPTLTPSLTPTITATPSEPATPTNEVNVTSTLAPTLSPTPAPIELVVNGDFELDTEPDKIPDGWLPKYLSLDKRVCNKPDKTVAFSGSCAFRFKGSIGEYGKIQQTLGGAQFGDTLVLSAALNTDVGTPGKLVMVKIRYSDPLAGVNRNGKDQIKLELAEATQGYQVIEQSLMLSGTPIKFTITVRFRGLSGKLLVDRVSLKKLMAARTADPQIR
jgi:hypothetical protein